MKAKPRKQRKRRGESREDRLQREIRASERYRVFLSEKATMVRALPAWLRGPLP